MISRQTRGPHRLDWSMWLDRGIRVNGISSSIVKTMPLPETSTGSGDADTRDILYEGPIVAPLAINPCAAGKIIAGVHGPRPAGKATSPDGTTAAGITRCGAPGMASGSLGQNPQCVITAALAKSPGDPPAAVSRATGASS